MSFQFIKTLSGGLSQYGSQNPALGELPLQILLHIVSCTSALRDILESQPKSSQSEVSSQVYLPFLNGFVGSLGKYLLDSLSYDPKTNLSQTLTAYQVTFRHLIRLFPELAKRRHKTTGKLLLHHIVLKSRPATIVEAMRATLALAPDSTKTPDSSGALPLHWATKNDSFPADCVDILVQSYPQCIQALDQKGCLPLHWAVSTHPPPLEVIKRLVKLYPKSSSVASSTGNLALHYAVSHDAPSLEVVNLLLAVFPDAVRHKNTVGELPIHRLLSRITPDMGVLTTLVQKFPEGLLVTNAQGHTPLHVALDHHLPSTILTYLIQQGGRAAEVGDGDGYYPLHMSL
ncbi:ankyrin repeat domain-containing protein, partial [archaeon]